MLQFKISNCYCKEGHNNEAAAELENRNGDETKGAIGNHGLAAMWEV